MAIGGIPALGFDFTFNGIGYTTSPATITGTVEGLVDNLDSQKTGLTVTVIGQRIHWAFFRTASRMQIIL